MRNMMGDKGRLVKKGASKGEHFERRGRKRGRKEKKYCGSGIGKAMIGKGD